jgi:hypothetical protein
MHAKITVSILMGIILSLLGCSTDRAGGASQPSSDHAPPRMLGRVQTEEIKESSGLAASRCQPNVLWTHNDAGSGPIIYAHALDGRHLGAWKVTNADNVDWEDIDTFKDPSGRCFLMIGDIGDNDEVRRELIVYRLPEPIITPDAAGSSSNSPLSTEPAVAIRFTYPDRPNNAETMMVHPVTNDIYIVTKTKKGPAAVYRVRAGNVDVSTAERLGEISMPADPPGLLTGGSISPDGKRVVLCDVQNGYELRLTDPAAAFDNIWRQKPVLVDLGDRKQGEGVTYSADGSAMIASSEKKNPPIFEVRLR